MREIAECMAAALADGRDVVLVTIAGGKGSAPRHAGSQMLVDAEGLACGTIGGGALEAHAIAQARALLGSGHGRFEQLDLVADLGMACGGSASLLYAAVRGGEARWTQLAAAIIRCLDERTPATLLLRCPEGQQLFEAAAALVDADGKELAGDCGAAPADADRTAGAGGFASLGNGSDAVDDDGAAGRAAVCDATPLHSVGAAASRFDGAWLALPLEMPVRAVVFGGGHVGRATVAALARVGFACTLFDSRPEFACPEDFLGAREVLCGDFDSIAASISLDERDFILIMTPGHNSDFAVLEQVLRQPHAYVGLIGSRRKIAAARQQMLAAGIPQADIDAVHMPIGLAIGAETPEEIAISITAECIQARAALRR